MFIAHFIKSPNNLTGECIVILDQDEKPTNKQLKQLCPPGLKVHGVHRATIERGQQLPCDTVLQSSQ